MYKLCTKASLSWALAHFEAASGTLGLGVGRPGEEASTHASCQSLLQQVLEAGGVHCWVLMLDIDLDGYN